MEIPESIDSDDEEEDFDTEYYLSDERIDYHLPNGIVVQPIPWLKRSLDERKQLWQHFLSTIVPSRKIVDKIDYLFAEPNCFSADITEEAKEMGEESFPGFDARTREFLDNFASKDEVFVTINNSSGPAISLNPPDDAPREKYFTLRSLLFLQGVPTTEIAHLELQMARYEGFQDFVIWQLMANRLRKTISIYHASGTSGRQTLDFELIKDNIVPREEWVPPHPVKTKSRLVTDEDGFTRIVTEIQNPTQKNAAQEERE